MKQEYTRSEMVSLLDALQQMFPSVRLADPATGNLLDAADMAPAGGACRIPVLDASGRAGCPTPTAATPSRSTVPSGWMASPVWW